MYICFSAVHLSYVYYMYAHTMSCMQSSKKFVHLYKINLPLYHSHIMSLQLLLPNDNLIVTFINFCMILLQVS